MDGDYKLKFHLAPPMFSKRDPDSGHLKKKEFGPYMMKAFGFLTKFKGLRGTPLDPFGYLADHKHERKLIVEFEKTVADLMTGLTKDNYSLAVEIANLPLHVRGFGHVKDDAIKTYEGDLAHLMSLFLSPEVERQAAE